MIVETPEEIAAREAAECAARAAECAARAADPVWRAEQQRKNDAASQRFLERRAALDMPIVQKAPRERM